MAARQKIDFDNSPQCLAGLGDRTWFCIRDSRTDRISYFEMIDGTRSTKATHYILIPEQVREEAKLNLSTSKEREAERKAQEAQQASNVSKPHISSPYHVTYAVGCAGLQEELNAGYNADNNVAHVIFSGDGAFNLERYTIVWTRSGIDMDTN